MDMWLHPLFYGITCWISIIYASTSTLDSRHAWVITSHCFNKKVILIHVLIPVLVWQLSVSERNPSWCIWARHRTITCINDGLDTWLHPLFYAQCNGITFWLSIIDALTSTLDSRHAWVITSHCFNKKVILIHVLIPVLVWQLSVSESNPSWCIWARHRTITCINDGLFSIGPLGAYRNDT